MGITQGPWEAGWGDGVTGARAAASSYWDVGNIVSIPVRVKNKVVCWVAEFGEDVDMKILEADAQFIAAAPEVFHALENLVAHHRKHFGLDGAWDKEILEAERVIEKVKAETK